MSKEEYDALCARVDEARRVLRRNRFKEYLGVFVVLYLATGFWAWLGVGC